MLYQFRKRTKLEDIVYSLYLYFSCGLSLRNTSKALSKFVHISHTAIRDWFQKYRPKRLFYRKIKFSEFLYILKDETQLKVGSEFIWLWIAIEPETKNIVVINISKERNMFVAERFLYGIIKAHGEHPVSTDDGGTWYPPQACRFLKLPPHHIHSSFEKSIIERRTIQYLKDRTENFDDYFPCRKKNCKLKHVTQWLNLFAYYYNREILS
jgi:putative transposase